jgi:hypothetical protein
MEFLTAFAMRIYNALSERGILRTVANKVASVVSGAGRPAAVSACAKLTEKPVL